ncbi:hypothetical protein DICPUDRAFT_152838 [Dictyostelium purpureum]|uniref:Uncharacterized protein n=1 Tax=Dictyostelium purpureum TaxID=5786 RepID=F0ZME4_DICPU|nr:uncharacterized protein DICPUDRAFT_152838 [Dictyostelium purpureum]EGC34901.1 hypothetical protein DICPUDRAFT_152838 [Dictyostelium purpureum]|eukprot:XP_003288593.1 hypothetical protein DICPUDRAFT_152838 [Dictyostelium purpureum]
MTTPRVPTTFTRKVPGGTKITSPAGGLSATVTATTTAAKKLPNGCKVSIHNSNLLTSTGLQDLDDIIGGGIPVGSILMIEEDINSSYYIFLLKYFLAEGILQQQGVFFSSLIGIDPFEILNKLPQRITKEEEIENDKTDNLATNSNKPSNPTDELKIAWRYQQYVQNELSKQPTTSSILNQTFCHSYDFTRKMNVQSMNPNLIHTLSYSSNYSQVEGSSPYRNLFLEIQNLVYKYNKEAAANPDQTKVLRLCIQSFSSPLWSNNEEGVIEFLHALKGLLRSSVCTCVISVPTYIYSSAFVKKISHLCDTVVSINSFSGMGGETPEQFAEYLGFFNIRKIARLNTLSLSFHPDMLTYVFKMKRRKMCIETIHLQPEMSRAGDSKPEDSNSNKKDDGNIVSKMKSGSGLLCGAENENFYKNETLKLIRNLCIEYYTNLLPEDSNVVFSVLETKWWLDLKKLFSFFDDNMFTFIFILFPEKEVSLELYDANVMNLFIVASLLSFDFIVELNSLSFEGSAIDTIIYSKTTSFMRKLPKFLREPKRKRKLIDKLYNYSELANEAISSNLRDEIHKSGPDNSQKDLRIQLFKLLFNSRFNYLNRVYCIYLALINSLSLSERGFLFLNKLKVDEEISEYLEEFSTNSISYLNYKKEQGGSSALENIDLIDFVDFKLFYQIMIQIQLKSIKSLEDLNQLFGESILRECGQIWDYVSNSSEPFIDLQVFSNPTNYFNTKEILEKIEKKSKKIGKIDNGVYLLENEFLNTVAPNSLEYLGSYKKDLDELTPQTFSSRFVDDFHFHSNRKIEPDAFSVKLKEFKVNRKTSLKLNQKSAAVFKKYADSLNDPINKLIINKLDPTKEELEKEKLKKEKEEFKKSFNKKSVPIKSNIKPKNERDKLLEERLIKDKKKFEENLSLMDSPLQTLKFLNNLDYLDKAFDLYESHFNKLLQTYNSTKEKKLIEKMEELKSLKFKEIKRVNPSAKKSEVIVTADMIDLSELELQSNEKVPYYQLVQNYLRYFNDLQPDSNISQNLIKSISKYLYEISKSILLFSDLANCLNTKFKLGKKELPINDNNGPNNNSIEFQIKETPETLVRNTGGKPDSRVRGFVPDKWQVELLDIVDNRESALICAPTSSGKTFISFYTFEKILRQDNEGIVVFIAPTKALVNQMYAEVLGRYEKNFVAINHRPSNNKTVGIFTRDWRLDMENCQILITVPQCLEILFLSIANIQFIQRIRYIIFDEVHQVCNTDGAVWERLLLFNPCPFLALSATLGNLNEFHRFLQKIDPERKVKLIHYTHRFNDLKTFFISQSRKEKKQDLISDQQETTKEEKEEKEIKKEESEENEEDEEIKFGYDEDNEENKDKKIERVSFEYKLNPLHPFSSLTTKVGGLNKISSDLTLIPSESHELFEALSKIIGYEKVKQFDPQLYFAKIENKEFNLEKQQIFNYQNELKEYYNNLSQEQKLSVSSSLTNPLYDNLKFKWESDITNIVLKLQEDKLLPAIIFCFNRTQCTNLAQRVYSDLMKRHQSPNTKEERRAIDLEIQRIEKAISAEKKQLDISDELMIELERLKSKKASLEYIKPQFGTISSSDIDKEYKIKNNPLTPVLMQGIGAHHSGCDKNYLRTVEFLFRGKKIQLLFATSSLAVGVNMPASTVVFAGDSPYLNVLTYRQCAGRAGRRGLDLRGNVGFLGISKFKINRLLNSNLSNITGNTVLSPSLCLSLVSRYDFSANSSNKPSLESNQAESNEPNEPKKPIDESEEIKDSWDNSDSEKESIKDSWDNDENEILDTSKINSDQQITYQPKKQLDQVSKVDIEILKKATKSLLNNSFFLGDPLQVQFLFSFSVDYLFREGFLNRKGVPLNHSGLVTHLGYLEPYNFVFVSLLRSGLFDNLSPNQKERDLYIIHVLSYLFCIQPIPSSKARSPSILVLPPLPTEALNIIKNHNQRLLNTFSTYVRIYNQYIGKNMLPLSRKINKFNDQYKSSSKKSVENWNNNMKPFKNNLDNSNTVNSLSGLFYVNNIQKLVATFHSNTYFSPSVLPFCEINGKTNSYLMDFYKHGQVKTILEDNGIKESDIWTLLKEFCLTLKVIEVALQHRDPDSTISNAFTGLSKRYSEKFASSFDF